jgi:endonuclease I
MFVNFALKFSLDRVAIQNFYVFFLKNDSYLFLKNFIVMKKILLFNLILLSYFFVSAQIPDGYYDATTGLGGDGLKQALNGIIKNHVKYEYTADTTDVWDILKETDRDTDNVNNVLLIYTGWSYNADAEYNGGAGWSREHIWPQSRGDFSTNIPGVGTDVHNLRPEDVEVNSARGNRWYSECSTSYLLGGTVPTGCFSCSSPDIWEPRPEVKGDVARIIFYMATRYEGFDGELDLEVVDYYPADDSKEPLFAKLSDLIAWNAADEVDDWEKNRNDVIYSFQHNRNPFIDHPEWVECIWNNNCTGLWFTSFPDTLMTEREDYSYSISASGSEDVQITISCETDLPDWLHFNSLTSIVNSATATLTGSPSFTDIRIYPISLKVSDGTNSVYQNFNIEVVDGNPIAFTSTPILTGKVDEVYSYNVTVSGDDGATFNLSGTKLPAWLSLTNNTGATATLTGTPEITYLGTNHVILTVFDITDGTKKTITQEFDIEVNPAGENKIIISQYYEGNSNDKYIEITNVGNSSVDLSTYYLARWGNTDVPSGVYANGEALSGTINASQSLIYKNSGAVNPTYAVSAAYASTEATFFNGNDPVALLRYGNTWDYRVDCIYGSLASVTYWGAENAFYRKQEVISGNINASVLDGTGEWVPITIADADNAVSQTSPYLGYHVFNALNIKVINNDLSVYPNPTKNIINFKTTNGIKNLEVLNITGSVLIQNNGENSSVNVEKLKSGLYILKITDNSGNIYFDKFIKE